MQLFKNNAYSTFAAAINSTATTLVVSAATGDRFPVVAGTDYFMLTLQNAANNIEIVKVTARATGSDSMTIIRAQEGTTARAWSIGEVVEQRITAFNLVALKFLEGVSSVSDILDKLGGTTVGKALFASADAGEARTAIGATTIGKALITAVDAAAARTVLGVNEVLQAVYPVGSLYFNSGNGTNPATLLGFGTWVAFGQGKVMLGAGAGFADGATGGSADAVVVSHSHTASTTSTDSGHQHSSLYKATTFNVTGSTIPAWCQDQWTATTVGYANITSITTVHAAGQSGTNANYQPYIVVNVWKRTA